GGRDDGGALDELGHGGILSSHTKLRIAFARTSSSVYVRSTRPSSNTGTRLSSWRGPRTVVNQPFSFTRSRCPFLLRLPVSVAGSFETSTQPSVRSAAAHLKANLSVSRFTCCKRPPPIPKPMFEAA